MTNNETVILLHGIGHASWNLAFLDHALSKQGYRTLNLSYPSRKHEIATLAGRLSGRLSTNKVWQNADKVHFVAHSMGGLVTNAYLTQYRDKLPQEKMGRAVMLGTPHGGSEVADFLQDNPLYKWAFGPAGQELTTRARRNSIAQPWYDLGIIAGNRNWTDPFGAFCIKEAHDGCVSVSSTRVEGMKDHITVPIQHGFMSWAPQVHRQVIEFLRHGQFDHNAAAAPR